MLKALTHKMDEVRENYEKEKEAKEAFEKELESIKKESAASGGGKHRKVGGGGGHHGSHMMEYEMEQHMFQSPEFANEYARLGHSGGPGSKRYVSLLSFRCCCTCLSAFVVFRPGINANTRVSPFVHYY